MRPSHRVEEIQVLRAIAVILVVLFHTRFDLTGSPHPALADIFNFYGGDVGVDLFFVISGYVIALSLIPSLQAALDPVQQRRVLLTFWVRRAFRLLPSAWFWLAVTLVCTYFFNTAGAFGTFKAAYEGTVAAVMHVANVRFMTCFGQFECGPTFVHWSLSLEQQFYIALPILVIISRRFLVPVLLVLFISQLPEFTSVLPGYRFSGLVLGVLLAIFSKSLTYRWIEPDGLIRHRWLATVFFLFLLVVMSVILGPDVKIVSGSLKYELASFVAGVLVLLASYDKGYILSEGRLRSLLVWIGERSYALYLIHIPAFYLSRELLSVYSLRGASPTEQWINHGLLALVLMLVLAELSYRFIELPWQRRGQAIISRFEGNKERGPAPMQSAPMAEQKYEVR